MLLRRAPNAVLELRAALFEVVVDRRILQNAQCRFSGCDGEWIPRESPGLIHRTERRDQLHHFSRAAVRADGQSTADDLAEGGDVGLHSVKRLRAAVGKI